MKLNWRLIIILIFSLAVRLYRYPQFPIVGETRDEVAWSMLGASLIQTGQPTSWSYFSAYYNDYFIKKIEPIDERGQKAIFYLVSPALDHPPLFSFIPGFFHQLQYDWDQLPSIKLIRAPLIVIGLANVYWLYLLAKQFFKDQKWAYLATVIYGLAPTFIFSSRLVVAENLLTTWVLLSLIVIKSWSGQKRFYTLILISLLSILTKVAGIIVPLSLIAYGLSTEQKKIAQSGFYGLAGGIMLFLGYGLIYNLPLLLEVQFSQGGRNVGLSTLANRFFLHPTIVEKTYFDGWVWLGLFSSIAIFFKQRKKYLLIFIFLMMAFLFNLATAGEQTFHGWYDYPIYALLIIPLTAFLKTMIEENQVWLWWLSWLILLPSLRLALSYTGLYHQLSALMMRSIVALGGLPLFGQVILKNKKLVQVSFYLTLGLVLAAGLVIVVFINPRTYSELNQFFAVQ